VNLINCFKIEIHGVVSSSKFTSIHLIPEVRGQWRGFAGICRDSSTCNELSAYFPRPYLGIKLIELATMSPLSLSSLSGPFSKPLNLCKMGHLPVSEEIFRFLVTMMDRSTRWLEAASLKDMAPNSCVDNFISTKVSRWGVPAHLTSDRGTHFFSAVWQALCTRMGISHIFTTALLSLFLGSLWTPQIHLQ